jgi:hypothetical protein
MNGINIQYMANPSLIQHLKPGEIKLHQPRVCWGTKASIQVFAEIVGLREFFSHMKKKRDQGNN